MAFTPQTTTYDFDQVSCMLGPIIFDGYNEGEGISIEHSEAAFTMIVGADGKVTRSKTLNETAKITITLLQSSAANDQMAALLTLDRSTPNGSGIVPFWVRDRGGRSLFKAAEAWIEGPPQAVFAREATARAWTICVSKLFRYEGGN